MYYNENINGLTRQIMIIAIAGMGLIGGSLAKDLKSSGFATRIIGVESDPSHAAYSLEKGLVDKITGLKEAVEEAGLVILATPTDTIREMLPEVLDIAAGTNRVVTDMGSTKAGMSKKVKDHPGRDRYVASHPMAGTEYSGPGASKSGLFSCKNAIICDREMSCDKALEMVTAMYNALKMNIIWMGSREHDISAAYVSHISHITSFALSLSVLEKEKDEKNILSLAGGGFESTVRLAKSNADTWTPIFLQNARFITEVIDVYIEKMKEFRDGIDNKDPGIIRKLIAQANEIEKILP